MDDTRPVVDPLELAQALLDNGDSLLSDAEYLLDGGRRERAAALSLMAAEEFSKLYLCLNAITGEAELPSATSIKWRGHRDKMETAKALELAFIDPEPDLDMETANVEVQTLVRLKMACIYVDHLHGEIRQPTDVVADVPALIASGRDKSALLHAVFDRITPEVMAAMGEYRDLMEGLAKALVDERDPHSTLRRLRSVAVAAALNEPEALQVALVSALEEVRATNELGALSPTPPRMWPEE